MDQRFENVAQVENGPRFVRTATFLRSTVKVVTGYIATHDSWSMHLYVQSPKDREEKKLDGPTSRTSYSTQEVAFERGFEKAIEHLDPAPVATFPARTW